MKIILPVKQLKLLYEKEKDYDYPDPLSDVIFKSIIRKDEEHIIIKTLIKEFYGVDVKSIEEKDSHFIAKGSTKKGEVCDYLDKLISIECNRNYNKNLMLRNYSHLKRTILDSWDEAVQIHFDNYDIGKKNKLVYCYSIRDDEGNEETPYQNLIKIFHINLDSLRKRMYNEDVNKFTKLEKLLFVFLVRTKKNFEILEKEEDLRKMSRIIDEIVNDDDIIFKYTNSELEALAAADKAREETEKKMTKKMADEKREMTKKMADDKKEMVQKMLLDNVDVNLISKYTNLSVEEIEVLKK